MDQSSKIDLGHMFMNRSPQMAAIVVDNWKCNLDTGWGLEPKYHDAGT